MLSNFPKTAVEANVIHKKAVAGGYLVEEKMDERKKGEQEGGAHEKELKERKLEKCLLSPSGRKNGSFFSFGIKV